MKLLSTVAFSLFFLISSCSFDECPQIREEQKIAYEGYLSIKNLEYSNYLVELKKWEDRRASKNFERLTKIDKCEKSPEKYFQDTKPPGSDFNFEFYRTNARIFGVSICESIVGPYDEMSFEKPKDESGNSSQAIGKYLISQRIIKNNPKCFTSTEVANAEQEISRLGDQR